LLTLLLCRTAGRNESNCLAARAENDDNNTSEVIHANGYKSPLALDALILASESHGIKQGTLRVRETNAVFQ